MHCFEQETCHIWLFYAIHIKRQAIWLSISSGTLTSLVSKQVILTPPGYTHVVFVKIKKDHIHKRKTGCTLPQKSAVSTPFATATSERLDYQTWKFIIKSTFLLTLPNLDRKIASRTLYHRCTEWLGLEATSKYHLVPMPLPPAGTSSTRLSCSDICMCSLCYTTWCASSHHLIHTKLCKKPSTHKK